MVVGLFAVQYGFNSLRTTLQVKQDRVDAARQRNDDRSRVATNGQIAARKISQLHAKSLPTEPEALVAQYRTWLTNIAQDVGMEDMGDIHVQSPERAFKTTNAYAAYNFSLTGTCRLEQAIELLAAFYDADYLHSARSFKMQMTPEMNVVIVTLESQALALRGADRRQQPSGESSGRLSMSVEEYKEAILGRNPFAPPNNPPQLATEGSHQLHRGESWSLDLEAEDEEGHRVSYELVSTELPKGLKLEGNSLRWNPEENGEYEVVVRAQDDGWPRQATEEKLTLKVQDPPEPEKPEPEPPKFDAASQAFVSALLSGRSGPEAWIRSRTEGKTLYLSEGSDFAIGSLKGKVVSINLKEDYVELETDGSHWTVGMDVSLADAYAKSRID